MFQVLFDGSLWFGKELLDRYTFCVFSKLAQSPQCDNGYPSSEVVKRQGIHLSVAGILYMRKNVFIHYCFVCSSFQKKYLFLTCR